MKIITVNKKAHHNYEIIEKIEAGMVLMGSEVKSIREGKINLKDSYIEIRLGEAILINSHISHYSNASYNNHEPERERKLLLHRREINKWEKKVKIKPLKCERCDKEVWTTYLGVCKKCFLAIAEKIKNFDKKNGEKKDV